MYFESWKGQYRRKTVDLHWPQNYWKQKSEFFFDKDVFQDRRRHLLPKRGRQMNNCNTESYFHDPVFYVIIFLTIIFTILLIRCIFQSGNSKNLIKNDFNFSSVRRQEGLNRESEEINTKNGNFVIVWICWGQINNHRLSSMILASKINFFYGL